jgi:hypothetical protein
MLSLRTEDCQESSGERGLKTVGIRVFGVRFSLANINTHTRIRKRVMPEQDARPMEHRDLNQCATA